MVGWSRDWGDGVSGEGWLEDGADLPGVWVSEWNECARSERRYGESPWGTRETRTKKVGR